MSSFTEFSVNDIEPGDLDNPDQYSSSPRAPSLSVQRQQGEHSIGELDVRTSTRIALHEAVSQQDFHDHAQTPRLRRAASSHNLRGARTSSKPPPLPQNTPLPQHTQRQAVDMRRPKSGPLRRTWRRMFSRSDEVSYDRKRKSQSCNTLPIGTQKQAFGTTVKSESVDFALWPHQYLRQDTDLASSGTSAPSFTKPDGLSSKDNEPLPSSSPQLRRRNRSGNFRPRITASAPSTDHLPSRPRTSPIPAIAAPSRQPPPVPAADINHELEGDAQEKVNAFSAPDPNGLRPSTPTLPTQWRGYPRPYPDEGPMQRAYPNAEGSGNIRKHHRHTSSVLAESGSPDIRFISNAHTDRQKSHPREAMELASVITRLATLEDRLAQVEEDESASKKRLRRIEKHLGRLAGAHHGSSPDPAPPPREGSGDSPGGASALASAKDTWLRDDSSFTSLDRESVPRTPPAVDREYSLQEDPVWGAEIGRHESSETAVEKRNGDYHQHANLLRDSLLAKGYEFSLQHVFSVVNAEHDARLNLQNDVAFIRDAIDRLRRRMSGRSVAPNSASPRQTRRDTANQHDTSSHYVSVPTMPGWQEQLRSRFSSDTDTSEGYPSSLDDANYTHLPSPTYPSQNQKEAGPRESGRDENGEVFTTPPLSLGPHDYG